MAYVSQGGLTGFPTAPCTVSEYGDCDRLRRDPADVTLDEPRCLLVFSSMAQTATPVAVADLLAIECERAAVSVAYPDLRCGHAPSAQVLFRALATLPKGLVCRELQTV